MLTGVVCAPDYDCSSLLEASGDFLEVGSILFQWDLDAAALVGFCRSSGRVEIRNVVDAAVDENFVPRLVAQVFVETVSDLA